MFPRSKSKLNWKCSGHSASTGEKKTSCKNTHQLCWIRRSCACANVNLADLKKENEWSANNKHTSDLEGPFIPVPRRKFIHKTGQVKTSTRANFPQTAETRKHCQGQVQTRSALFLNWLHRYAGRAETYCTTWNKWENIGASFEGCFHPYSRLTYLILY